MTDKPVGWRRPVAATGHPARGLVAASREEAALAALPSLLLCGTIWLLVLPVGLLMGIASAWGSQAIALGGDVGFDGVPSIG